jgi:hypothetical protein
VFKHHVAPRIVTALGLTAAFAIVTLLVSSASPDRHAEADQDPG